NGTSPNNGDAGQIDLGGGANSLGSSKGGNDFRGFTGQNGHFSIELFNTGAAASVSARSNISDAGIFFKQTVSDGTINGGTGVIGAVANLDPDHAFVQTLYRDLLGRIGDPSPGGEIDGWVAMLPTLGRAGVAHALLYSTESLDRVVTGYYIRFLGRAPQGGE